MLIIGGGVTGIATALELLSPEEFSVTIVERADRLGGLVTSFQVGRTPLECYYHHVFPDEMQIYDVLDQLALSGKLEWFRTRMGVYAAGRAWPFTTATDLLRFRPLPLLDRFRAGRGALRMRRREGWMELDRIPAMQWLTEQVGPRAAELLFAPLLRARFGAAADEVPAAWLWARFQQRRKARKRGGERLGYLRGGFKQMFDVAALRLADAGVDLRFGTTVRRIVVEDGRVLGVHTDQGPIEADQILYTGPLALLPGLVDDPYVDRRWRRAESLGVLCVVVELSRPLTRFYWTNVCDPELPFGGLIEHTNMVPASDYGGRHIVYLSRYFPPGDPLAEVDVHVEAQRWVEALCGAFDLDAGAVLGVHPFRTHHAAPRIYLRYLDELTPLVSHIGGLFVATTAQIYPQDRGMDQAARMGVLAAHYIATTPPPARVVSLDERRREPDR